ncbi:methyltransferase, TIGR04325 family [Rhodopseudomonas palustris]|uniref:Methyltransferase, TIGR04325 family n=1 Tax=Rhodopseudomonas palustris TaxID=1076 RepID=A0A323UJB5_RHOPL|nr:TIGR04325 family methyltransferase [Rhodopseudomonas palustris]PZA12795.1 methyltransferase, TIGR04325 family [Rhodopseudomonas palustris]
MAVGLNRMRVGIGSSTAVGLRALARLPHGTRLIRFMARHPLIERSLRGLLCVYQPFPDIETATKYIRRFIPAGHEHSDVVSQLKQFADVTRESDYPVLFYLCGYASGLSTVFDLGGGIGNLFYPYDRELRLPATLRWMVHDLPDKEEIVLQFAKSRNEHRVGFSRRMEDASGVDLFIVSGALHYFEDELAVILGRLAELPRLAVVNRTPFSRAEPIVTTQVGDGYVHACKLHSLAGTIAGMEAIGYRLIAKWPVHERASRVPLRPDLNDTYWGLFFVLDADRRPKDASQ